MSERSGRIRMAPFPVKAHPRSATSGYNRARPIDWRPLAFRGLGRGVPESIREDGVMTDRGAAPPEPEERVRRGAHRQGPGDQVRVSRAVLAMTP